MRVDGVLGHVTHGESVGLWLRLEDGTVRTGLRQLENNRAPYDLGWSPDRRGHVRTARRPSAGLSPTARSRPEPSTLTPAADRRRPARPRLPPRLGPSRRMGPGHPAVQRALATVMGHRRSDRPVRPRRCGRPRHGAGFVLVESAARGRAARRRWNRRPICRPRAASSTRCTCGSRRSPSSPTCRNRGRHLRKAQAIIQAEAPTGVEADRPGRCVEGQTLGRWKDVYRVPRSAGRELAYAAYRQREGRQPRRLRHLVCARRGARQRLASSGRRFCSIPGRLGRRRVRRRNTPIPSTSTAGCGGSCDDQLTAAQATAACRRAWRSASCTTLRSAVDPNGADAGAAGRAGPSASTRARRRTSSTSSARTGRNRRGGPTSLVEQAYAPFRAWSTPCCGTRAAFASTTSSGCSGCGGSRRARRRPTAPTCATTTRR